MLAVQAGDAAAQQRGSDYYSQWVDDPASVDAELAAAATTIVASIGGVAEYERMLHRAIHGATPQEQLRHLFALAEFDDPDLMIRTLMVLGAGLPSNQLSLPAFKSQITDYQEWEDGPDQALRIVWIGGRP